jgi:hypothetical protein
MSHGNRASTSIHPSSAVPRAIAREGTRFEDAASRLKIS